MTSQKSKCCGGALLGGGSGGVTRWHVCGTCGQACDPQSDTPRTDRIIDLIVAGIPCPTLDAHARDLERELRLAEMAAKDNADWFNCLVRDLAKLLGCAEKPSAVLEAVGKLVREPQ